MLITAVEVLDEKGVDKRSFQSGENVRIVVNYRTQADVEQLRVNIGLEIRSKSGVYVYGINTRRDGSEALSVKKMGTLEVLLEKLALTDGEYTIGIAFGDQEETISYDHYHELTNIKVFSGIAALGVVNLAHKFLLDGKEIERKEAW